VDGIAAVRFRSASRRCMRRHQLQYRHDSPCGWQPLDSSQRGL